MKVRYTALFNKDIAGISEAKLVDTVKEAIENVKQAKTPQEIRKLKKLKTSKKCYRIRMGNYRIGLFIEKDTVEFSRFLHRRNIYKKFP